MKDGRLHTKNGFIEHNHQTQDFEHSESDIEKHIKDDCGNLDVLVNARSQSSAISEIFDKHMKKYVKDSTNTNGIFYIIILYFYIFFSYIIVDIKIHS